MSSALQIIAGTTGNFQQNNAPPSNPSPVDDARAIERADDWLFSEDSPQAADDDCFPTAVAVATILRELGLSALVARDRVESWSLFACSPQLEQADVDLAVQEAYGMCASAVPPQPSSAIVAPTTPSPLTASPLAVVAASSVNTTECALCAARRKAKRERTRRWRARTRNTAQPARNAMEVANV